MVISVASFSWCYPFGVVHLVPVPPLSLVPFRFDECACAIAGRAEMNDRSYSQSETCAAVPEFALSSLDGHDWYKR